VCVVLVVLVDMNVSTASSNSNGVNARPEMKNPKVTELKSNAATLTLMIEINGVRLSGLLEGNQLDQMRQTQILSSLLL